MTYARRRIDLRFQLGEGAFGEGGFDTVDVSGLRVSASINKAGGVSMSQLQMRVYGLDLSTMNKLSTLGKPITEARLNTVTVTAGDDVKGMAIAFSGTINSAYVDMRGAPEAMLVVDAITGVLAAYRPLPPVSYPGGADAAVIASGLATQMGFSFENNDVSVQLSTAYYWGDGLTQLAALARDANFDYILDDNGPGFPTLAIWPKGRARGGLVPLVSAATGMIGYPMYTQQGLAVASQYNASIVNGRPIVVESDLNGANGQWLTYSVQHELESETPGGRWETVAQCTFWGGIAVGR